MKATFVALVFAAASCTRPNPAVCCLDPADCDEAGIPEVRGCAEGLACVEHQCTVPSCAQAGCGASAPVCNTTTDVCDPCTDSAECARFPDTPVCEATAGSCVQCLASGDCSSRAATPVCNPTSQTCVECLASSDCGVAKPICDAGNFCRVPANDNECPSGAMADDGTCVPEGDAVYLDPNGTDVGSCNRAVPCKSVPYAVSVTTAGRYHLVFAPGQYSTGEETYGPGQTPAPALFFHGHGAEIRGPTTGSDGCVMSFYVPATLRDLKATYITSAMGSVLCVSAGPTVLERVDITNGQFSTGLEGSVTARALTIANGYRGISAGGSLTIDGAVIHGPQVGIESGGTASVQLTNVLVYGTSDRALALSAGTSGTVSSSTFVTAGAGATGRTLNCPSTVLVRSSIVWAPGATTPILGCTLMNVIAGPAVVGGASNSDPLFIDLAQNNYHLGPGSPARDAVDTGPALDFEGDARPQGARFDLGADEATP